MSFGCEVLNRTRNSGETSATSSNNCEKSVVVSAGFLISPLELRFQR